MHYSPLSFVRTLPPCGLGRLARALAGMALAGSLALSGASLAAATSTAHAAAFGSSIGVQAALPAEAVFAAEAQLVELVNADRVANGLGPLHFGPELTALARWRSEDMLARDYLSHDIGGYQVFQVLEERGDSYRVAGENLAFNYAGEQAVPAAEDALMNSPTHRANILRPDFTHIGVGIAVGADGKYLFTQLFKRAA